MDKAIVTVLLIISGVVAALAVFNGVMPAIDRSQSAIVDAANSATNRMASRISIIQAGSSGSQVNAWVKNVGTNVIDGVPQSDVFLGSASDLSLIPYGGVDTPRWEYDVVGGGEDWGQTATIAVTIHLESPLSSGIYKLTMVTPNGVSAETNFSVN